MSAGRGIADRKGRRGGDERVVEESLEEYDP